MRGCSGATLAGLQVEFINPIFEFSRAMRRLGLDDAEYALLIAINIFSADRPNVQEPSRVEALQQPYVEALLSYTRIKRPQVRKLPRPGRQARCWVWWTMWGVLSLGSVCLCSQILVSVSRVSVLMRSAAMSQALGWVRGWPDPSWYWLSRLSWPGWAGPPAAPVSSPLQDQLRFPRMLMKLVSLRTLSSVHSEQVFALRLQDKKLPPLLSEIWDVHE